MKGFVKGGYDTNKMSTPEDLSSPEGEDKKGRQLW
jgi:hypothetical protein